MLLIAAVAGWTYYSISDRTSENLDNDSVGSQKTEGGDTSPQAPQPYIDTALEGKIAAWAAKQTGTFSVSVREINGSLRSASYQQDKPMVPASTYKLFVAYAVLHEIEQGNYSLQSRTRTGATVEKCLEVMIVNSDNECGRALGFLLGWENINKFLQEQGFKNTDLNNYDTSGNLLASDKSSSARDESELLIRLEGRRLLNENHTMLLIDLMKRQVWKERIVAGLPAGITAASKPGWLAKVQTDAAIVYGAKSKYVLVILSDSSSPQPLAELSRLVYSYLQQ